MQSTCFPGRGSKGPKSFLSEYNSQRSYLLKIKAHPSVVKPKNCGQNLHAPDTMEQWLRATPQRNASIGMKWFCKMSLMVPISQSNHPKGLLCQISHSMFSSIYLQASRFSVMLLNDLINNLRNKLHKKKVSLRQMDDDVFPAMLICQSTASC